MTHENQLMKSDWNDHNDHNLSKRATPVYKKMCIGKVVSSSCERQCRLVNCF
jgi:hypothetical protein